MLLQAEYLPEWVETWLSSELGLLVLFGICILEGAMMLRFMPSELVVPGALLVMGASPSTVVLVVIIAVIGTTIGQYLLFRLLRRGGREYLLEKRWFRVSESRLDTLDRWFDRWGPIAVPVSNSMLMIRGLLTIPAGLSEMDHRKFVVLSAIGSLSFQTILAGLYLVFGHVLLF
ncbi:membrane protein DedA, SNARE-associated domain [Natronoarchaeum philippinense]|uniref:Membrane protein DedA, SNARE-associated domain n=1 Tax=Natronoarchaeum philippinense TaxID=558529 RepID=A0A285NA73_NATPI|nr:VTT domain-containing protein [Natronoarchaeum philippinense]SNZ05803.1 membrane protein DedA, SNARE-associated domain [Natronoarchaeum philippinense]